MLFLFDKNLLTNGYCWGEDNCRLDDESRLCLHRDTLNILAEHGVIKLYRCPDPTGERFLLCPEKNWQIIAEAVERQFAKLPDSDKAMRLLCSGTPAAVDSQGRIKITITCLNHAKIGLGTRVKLLGVGHYYEISKLL
jgi:DNA-binding transcriptional regulator/RsmH inhibitor MraZ